jgi:cytochrome c5
MTDRAFLKTFSGLLGALVALTVIIFVVAQMVSGTAKTKTAVNDSQLIDRIKPVGELAMAGATAVANSVIPTANAADKGDQVYHQTCVACHGAGVAGAPKFGDKAAWAEHIAKGKDTLYNHALHGFTGKKGMMPAKGGNMGLSDADVKAAVDYMVDHSK